MSEVTFYIVTNRRFFIGAVGLVNSLRLMGHEQRIFIMDCGLVEHQRDVLKSECELVEPPASQAVNPQLLKPFPQLLRPQGTVVILDSDVVVTHPLDAVIETARNGQICVCADPEPERWFAEWEQIFALPCRPRHQTYVNSGFVVFSVDHYPNLLPRWWEYCQRIRSYPTTFHGAPDSPTAQADQDALNAILMSELPEETLAIQPQETQPSMEQLRWDTQLLDANSLSCLLYGQPVTIVHPTVPTKPFERQWWFDQAGSPYPALLRRLLVNGDVRMRLDHDEVPVWLRPNRLGAAVMYALYLINTRGNVRYWGRKWPLLRRSYRFLRRWLRSLRK